MAVYTPSSWSASRAAAFSDTMMLDGSFLKKVSALAAFFCLSAGPLPTHAQSCIAPGQWAMPAASGARIVSPSEVVDAAREARFVLLGEDHDNPDHHRWQLHSLGMLLGARGKLVIGMEMLPRRAQPVLDRWVAGDIGEAQLLRETQWNKVWRFDAELYLPIFHFARLHRLPLIALNVDRGLVRDVGGKGWKAIPPAQREGVSDPAPPSTEYREHLRGWFEQHRRAEEPDDPAAFERFVEAQLTWDRAFAEALAQAAARDPEALVVGIIGSGHLRNGHGVPHQLRALRAGIAKIWLPVTPDVPCGELTVGLADAVFAIAGARADDTPKLGVLLDEESEGLRVRAVVAGSVAESAGVKAGDRVLTAAGLRVASAEDLIALIRRQPPGTWLPLKVQRSGRELELVAKFPPAAE